MLDSSITVVVVVIVIGGGVMVDSIVVVKFPYVLVRVIVEVTGSTVWVIVVGRPSMIV